MRRSSILRSLLEVEGISKRYPGGSQWVLQDVRFSLRAGEVLWLRGANGSGKTTLLKIVAQLLRPTVGRIFFNGQPLQPSHRRWMGFGAGDERSFHLRLSARQNLEIAAAMYGLTTEEANARIERWSAPLGLRGQLDRRSSGLSTGQRDRLGLLRALLHQPQLLLLDEPGRSQDGAMKQSMWQVLEAFRATGGASIVVAHEAAALADCRAYRLQEGRLQGVSQ